LTSAVLPPLILLAVALAATAVRVADHGAFDADPNVAKLSWWKPLEVTNRQSLPRFRLEQASK
jgi:hypothetical protein